MAARTKNHRHAAIAPEIFCLSLLTDPRQTDYNELLGRHNLAQDAGGRRSFLARYCSPEDG
jgi:hypothetical protein